ncbi:fimbrillin family protein [Prevotella sp. MA2016]|uniref:fimbrillin family protein n=1 Tax=Prevotella sp. MA2016 TaxID=1408310 RepID=UPI0009DF03A2|nr:fimbrillin family protein [Prevotella sp. MA2016]
MNIKHYILLPISALMLASCASDEAANSDSTTDERLPLRFATSLSTERPLTRAYDNTIETTDELLSYVRHVYVEGTGRTSVQASLVTIKNNQPTKALYWDDFSQATDDGSKDLHTPGHALQSYYGYCYNGATVTDGQLIEETGVLSWETGADQTAGIKPYDLLWSDEQNPVEYQHAKDAHGTINVPYTHAMSKFTVVVVAGDGFKTDDLTTATVTLHGMNLKGTFTAPTAKVTAEETTEVKMHGNATSTTTDNKPCRAFEAVVVPNTALNGNEQQLATIEMDGNNYKVMVSESMLTSWATGLTGGKSRSGVNYKLTVTLNKQAVAVTATLSGWSDVSATGTGEIQFANDVKTIDTNDASLKDGDKFRLYWKKSDAADYDYATTATYDGSKFNNSPAIYWPNGRNSYYFRALSGTDDTSVAQGKDVLWGTSGDEAIAPRTGTVPLTFSHAMSKVQVVLKTSEDDAAKAVDLTGATVTMTAITTDGSISVATGSVAAGSKSGVVTISGETFMVPQTIAETSRIVITWEDGTSYSLALKGITNIDKWESGNSYTYTIYVEKEAVKFSAKIEPWDPKSGSGNASLDWD